MWVCRLSSQPPYKCFELKNAGEPMRGGVDFDLHVCIFIVFVFSQSLSGGFYVFYAYFNISARRLLCLSLGYNITL